MIIAGGIFASALLPDIFSEWDNRPIGIVDELQLLDVDTEFSSETLTFIFIDSSHEADTALEDGTIQAYYLIPHGYWQTGYITVTYHTSRLGIIDPLLIADTEIEKLIEDRVESEISQKTLSRMKPSGTYIIRHDTTDESAELVPEEINEVWGLIFVIVYALRNLNFFIVIRTFDAIASENENRTLEIMITSISPMRMITSKILGLMMVGITQLVVWGTPAIILIMFTPEWAFDVMRNILDWEHLPLFISIIIASSILDHILAAGMAVLQIGSGAGGIIVNLMSFAMLFVFPYAFLFVPRNPDTLLAIVAGMFPLSAPYVLPIRVIVSQVPDWQIILSQVLLWGYNVIGLIWLKWIIQRRIIERTPVFNLKEWMRPKMHNIRMKFKLS